MKKLLSKYLHISDDEKLTEETYLTRTVLSVLAIAICLVALCSATYAFFSDTISAPTTTITAAIYKVTVNTATATADQPYTYTCPSATDDLHTFTISAENSTAETGYCKLEVTDKNGIVTTYYTTQIFRTDGGVGRATSITLSVTAAEGCTISVIPQWGTSASYVADQSSLYSDGAVITHSVSTSAAAATVEAEQSTPDQGTATDINTASASIENNPT